MNTPNTAAAQPGTTPHSSCPTCGHDVGEPDPIRIEGASGWNPTTGRRFDIARRPCGGWRLILLQDGEEEGGAIFEPGEHADALLLGASWVADNAALTQHLLKDMDEALVSEVTQSSKAGAA